MTVVVSDGATRGHRAASTTALERNDIGASSRDRFIIAMKQAIPPVGKRRDDFTIFSELAIVSGCERRLPKVVRDGVCTSFVRLGATTSGAWELHWPDSTNFGRRVL